MPRNKTTEELKKDKAEVERIAKAKALKAKDSSDAKKAAEKLAKEQADTKAKKNEKARETALVEAKKIKGTAYILLSGKHRDGKNELYTKGDIVVSKTDLMKAFKNKFQKM